MPVLDLPAEKQRIVNAALGAVYGVVLHAERRLLLKRQGV